jgi:hypothetical protein
LLLAKRKQNERTFSLKRGLRTHAPLGVKLAGFFKFHNSVYIDDYQYIKISG